MPLVFHIFIVVVIMVMVCGRHQGCKSRNFRKFPPENLRKFIPIFPEICQNDFTGNFFTTTNLPNNCAFAYNDAFERLLQHLWTIIAYCRPIFNSYMYSCMFSLRFPAVPSLAVIYC